MWRAVEEGRWVTRLVGVLLRIRKAGWASVRPQHRAKFSHSPMAKRRRKDGKASVAGEKSEEGRRKRAVGVSVFEDPSGGSKPELRHWG